MSYKILMNNKLIVLLVFVSVLSACTKPSPRKPIVRNTSSFLNESIKRNKIINKSEESALLDLMKNDTSHQYISSKNGFWYYYIRKNSKAILVPKKGDIINYSYSIKDIYGDMLYTQKELGVRSYIVDKQELITGLQDGLKLMKEGEEVVFLFPSYKAYGYSGYQKIGTNQPLIYTVNLKKIKVNQ